MDYFFGIHIDPGSIGGMTAALALSVILGGLVGLEREIHGHPAGLRTHVLVCVGSALITIVSVHIGLTQANEPNSRADPARLAAQIVSGIGFLGAGAIIREGASIRGLTTAASIWSTAGIGIAVGAAPIYGELAVIGTVLVLFTLYVLSLTESWLTRRIHHVGVLDVRVRESEKQTAQVLAHLAEHGIEVRSIDYDTGPQPNTRQLLMHVTVPPGFDRNAFLSDMSGDSGVLSVSFK